MMLLYNLLWPVGLLVFLPGFFIKMFRRGGYRKNFGQRLGFYGEELAQRVNRPPPVWMHAVSVGEVGIALKLTAHLQALNPDSHFVLTTTTTTGHAVAEKSAPPSMTVLYTPLDFLPIMRRAFRFIAPRQIILIEAEVWPNMVNEATRQKIPVALANARLSERSEKKFRRFAFMLAPVFRKLSLACVTDEADAARWQRLGLPPDRIRAVGNIKFDAEENTATSTEPRRFLSQIGIAASRPVLLGGSTHRGEESILIETFVVLRREFPDLVLIIAPRHVERAGGIEARIRLHNLRMAKRTQPEKTSPDILLLDTTGELADWYSVATVVFIGKSLTAHGGQNPVEAIAAGKPVVFGPHMENFASLSRQLLENNGALCARSSDELVGYLGELLRRVSLREATVKQAAQVLEPHRGATRRTAELIQALV